jgi:hypothetical protein
LASGSNPQRFNPDLVVDRPVWEPSLYAPLVTRLSPAAAGAAGPAPTATNGGPGLLVQLAQFDAESLEAASQSVSRGLVGDFLDPRLHQQAALVLGTFGLRESCGDFYDVREVLCRMTAHLAVAGREAGASLGTPEGAVAEAILYTLMGNQQDALGKLARLDSGPEVRPWKRSTNGLPTIRTSPAPFCTISTGTSAPTRRPRRWRRPSDPSWNTPSRRWSGWRVW